MLTLKTRVLNEIQNPEFPNLEFLFSNEALAVAGSILNELLEQEQAEFQKILQVKNEDITFEIIEKKSLLTYYFTLLKYYS